MSELLVYGATHVGMFREENEDDFGYFRLEDVHLIVVADGMGGHAGGKMASGVAVETIRDVFERAIKSGDPMYAVNEAMAEANEKIRSVASQNEELQGMGATCVVAAVKDRLLYYSHLGDCRLYLVRDGKMIQLTRDHTMVQRLVDLGLIPQEVARFHPDKNVVSRALGGGEFVELDDPLEPVVLDDGDIFLLCSDGLFDLLSDEEILEAVTGHALEDVCQALITMANDAGGRDNITVQVGGYKKDEGVGMKDEG